MKVTLGMKVTLPEGITLVNGTLIIDSERYDVLFSAKPTFDGGTLGYRANRFVNVVPKQSHTSDRIAFCTSGTMEPPTGFGER
jgi:hypothetical protein